MASKLLIVGAGGFGRVTLEHASRQFDCAFVDDGRAAGAVVDGVEVVGGSSDLQRLHDEAGFNQLVVTIGNNKLREDIYIKAKALGYSFPNIVCSSAYMSTCPNRLRLRAFKQRSSTKRRARG